MDWAQTGLLISYFSQAKLEKWYLLQVIIEPAIPQPLLDLNLSSEFLSYWEAGDPMSKSRLRYKGFFRNLMQASFK